MPDCVQGVSQVTSKVACVQGVSTNLFPISQKTFPLIFHSYKRWDKMYFVGCDECHLIALTLQKYFWDTLIIEGNSWKHL